MNSCLSIVKASVYDKLGFSISEYEVEPEGKAYSACKFLLSGRKVVCRDAKVTAKKVGQFVTFWKRQKGQPIQPFDDSDTIDFFVVNVRVGEAVGQFVFPKSVLIEREILSSKSKEGKRAFRVYPSWDLPTSKQAKQTQKWQLNYFFCIHENTDLEGVLKLYRV